MKTTLFRAGAVVALVLMLAGCKEMKVYGRCLEMAERDTTQMVPLVFTKFGPIYTSVPAKETYCSRWEYPDGRPPA